MDIYIYICVCSITSGAIQATVPILDVIDSSKLVKREIPKSDNFASQCSLSNTFFDFKSRWMIYGQKNKYLNREKREHDIKTQITHTHIYIYRSSILRSRVYNNVYLRFDMMETRYSFDRAPKRSNKRTIICIESTTIFNILSIRSSRQSVLRPCLDTQIYAPSSRYHTQAVHHIKKDRTIWDSYRQRYRYIYISIYLVRLGLVQTRNRIGQIRFIFVQ
jgi:hypothetical protein